MRHLLALALAAFLAAGAVLAAQQPRVHLNPVIAKLAAGRTVYGLINAGDLSIVNARETARAPVDFVYADMEHNPLDFAGLATFLLGLTDKAAILSKGNLQPNVALFARFPPEADQSNWVVKQALDMGLMGVIFNGVDRREQAVEAIRSMRYPPLKGETRREPVGIRGYGTAAATWAWGVSAAEYERRADVWPLNPDGDLLAVLMIESVEGLRTSTRSRRCRASARSSSGPAAICRGRWACVPDAPEVEAGFQRVLAACKTHNVACAISAASGADVARRVKEGWRIIRSTVPAITQGRQLLGEK